MEEIIELRRKRTNKGQFTSDSKIGLRFSIKDGRFVVFSNLSKLLELKNKDAIMFGISKKDNCIFVYKEDKQDDNYVVSKTAGRDSYSRFTSKELCENIVDYLGLKDKQDYYFEIVQKIGDKVKLIKLK